jgi:predicted Zn-dependent protease
MRKIAVHLPIAHEAKEVKIAAGTLDMRAVDRLGPIPVLVEGAATQLANAGRREEAARMVLLGLARAGDRLAWHRERLAWAFAAGEVEVARALVARIDALTGHSTNLAIELAQAELRLGEVGGARDRLVAAAVRRPSDARLWAALADLEVGAGHPEEAVAALRREAADLHPDRGGDPDAFRAAYARYARAKAVAP